MADKAIGVHLKDWHIVQGVRTGNSPWSPIAIAQVPVKEPAPSAPVIESVTAPEASAGVLEIKVGLPETNADGTALARAELVRLRLHHSTSPGVTESDPYVDFPPSETLLWAPNDTVTHYVRVRVQDSHGLWSELSNEASGKANAATVSQEDSGLWAHRLGVESIFTNDSPEAGYVSWSNVVLYWRDNKYEIEDGSTDKKYIWWDYSTSTTTFQTSDTRPELDLEDVIIGYNDNGTWRLMCYQPTVMADYVRAGVLQSSNWGATTGSQLNLDDGTFKLGGSDSPALSWDGSILAVSGTIQAGSNLGGDNVVTIDSSGLDVGSSGRIKGGATGFESGAGFWLGYSGGYKFYIGNKSTDNYLSWDGSTLRVRGDLSVDTISFDRITAGTNTASLTIGSGGYIQSANYSAGSSGFRISGSGDAEFNDVTVRGTLITTGEDSNINADYIKTGTITGRKFQTAASGRRAVLETTGTYNHHLLFYDSYYLRLWIAENGISARDSSNVDSFSLNGPDRVFRLYDNSGNLALTIEGGNHPAITFYKTGDLITSGTSIISLSGDIIRRFSYSGIQIFSGYAPTTWTTLNLSGYVRHQALVFLKVKQTGPAAAHYAFKAGDDTDSYSFGGDWPQCSGCRIAAGEAGTVWVVTDSNCLVKWKSSNGYPTAIWLLAYIT